MTTAEDVNTVQLKIEEQIRDSFGGCSDEVMRNPLVFGDFKCAVERLRDGEDGGFEDPQLYEDQGMCNKQLFFSFFFYLNISLFA